ncbi:hypothetical protein DL96DRAFT_1614124 [Flagelloscypha sp. PMI_526]|nr:hypothetical protein DL96DRAFT_1614124 [Flagelloscypha sp. PMI_526]
MTSPSLPPFSPPSRAHLPGGTMDAFNYLDLQLLAEVLRFYFLSTGVAIISYGLYLPLFLKSVLLISPRLRSSVPSRWLLALILVLFIPTTVHLIAGMFTTLTLLQFASGGPEDSSASRLGTVSQLIRISGDAFFYSGRVNILLIDVIVVWRAYALQPHRRWLRILLMTLLIFALGFTVLLSIAAPDPWRYSVSEGLRSRLNIARELIALSVTVLGAACIGWTAWTFQKSVKEAQFRHRTTPFVTRTFQVLIEGCVILTLLQIAAMSVDLKLMDNSIARDSSSLRSLVKTSYILLSEITIIASAIHPSLVTVLVSDESKNAQSPIGVSETKLSSFAVAPPTTSTSTV